MVISDLLAKVVEAASALSLRYYVTGSVASSIWGEQRSTNDLDIEKRADTTFPGRSPLANPCSALNLRPLSSPHAGSYDVGPG